VHAVEHNKGGERLRGMPLLFYSTKEEIRLLQKGAWRRREKWRAGGGKEKWGRGHLMRGTKRKTAYCAEGGRPKRGGESERGENLQSAGWTMESLPTEAMKKSMLSRGQAWTASAEIKTIEGKTSE